jgi:hypothetical protein
MKHLLTALCVGLALSFTAVASAETTKRTPSPRSAKSIECSKLADAQNLHGKPRKAFRKKCLKGQVTG